MVESSTLPSVRLRGMLAHAGWITIRSSDKRWHWIPRWGGTLCTLEFRQQHWLAALPAQPCFAAYAGNQTTLQGSVPYPTSSLPLGPPMLLVHQFGHLALGLLWGVSRSQWRTYACPGTKGIARSRARVGSGMPALHASSPIWWETVQQHRLTQSTNVGVARQQLKAQI